MTKGKRKVRENIERALLLVGVVAVVVVGTVFARSVYRSLHQEEKESVTPIGDASSEIYDWEGNYMDTAGLQTTMSIVKRAGGFYDISISQGAEGSQDLVFWTMTATYNSAYRALEYRDAVRSDWVIPTEATEGGKISTDEIYTNGKGYLYLADDRVYWHDNNEDMGNGMQFEKTK